MIQYEEKQRTIQAVLDEGMFQVFDGRVYRMKFCDPSRPPQVADTRRSTNGYRRVMIHHKSIQFTIQAHRLVMCIVKGRPLEEAETVDHFDSDKLNNRPSNLRVVGWSQNQERAVWTTRMKCPTANHAEIVAYLIRQNAKQFKRSAEWISEKHSLTLKTAQMVLDNIIFPDTADVI